ncbi:hypothetical protein HCC61_14870 [Streptomyces sp. HNM0575]|nr:hypothetical protein [Streptomyces sp. HNM0575]NLU73947.1 hypothetical protein [Streptomyces sp. HNM0575]
MSRVDGRSNAGVPPDDLARPENSLLHGLHGDAFFDHRRTLRGARRP